MLNSFPQKNDKSQLLDSIKEDKKFLSTKNILNGKKIVAITFDDGPNPDTTPELLEVLKITTFVQLFLP